MTPYDRLRQQQLACNEDIIGYAVATAAERTRRAAYMTGNETELTNDERTAAILTKDEAARLMVRLYDSESWYDRALWPIAFLVPVSVVRPLTACTFNGW